MKSQNPKIHHFYEKISDPKQSISVLHPRKLLDGRPRQCYATVTVTGFLPYTRTLAMIRYVQTVESQA